MKKLFLFLFLVLFYFLISCNSKEKYQGKWVLDIFRSENESETTPMFFQIKNDSIKFNYWSFNHSHKYPLKIEENRFLFNNWSIKTHIAKDTLSLQNSFYIRDNNDSIMTWLWDKPITKIKLPKIKNLKFENTNNDDLKQYVLYGRRMDNNEFCLQLNDKYADISELPEFIAIEKASTREVLPFYSTYMFIEKTTPMKYIENMFYYLKLINQLKISLVSDIKLKYTDSLGLNYEYYVLNRILPYFHESDNYKPNIDIQFPPPSPPYLPLFDNQNIESKSILLKKDVIYINNSIINISELETTLKKWIQNKNAIFSLYDLESTYGKFLELTALINSVYYNQRNQLSKSKFQKPLNELSRKEITSIKLEIPMYHIWSYSIPHYNHVVRLKGNFFGIKTYVK